MASVYVDTNILLDFYRGSQLSLETFEDLRKLGKRLVLTEQTVNEFERNRSEVVATKIADLAEFGIAGLVLPAGLMSALDEFKELEKARKIVEQRVKKMQEKLRKYFDDDSSDPVLAAFREVSESAKVLPTTEDNVRRAHHRYLLGNPPTSRRKNTICDELIWETLLGGCKDDLYLCSRDHTFNTNELYLRAEYRRVTTKQLTVTEKLAVAMKGAGADATQVEKAELDLTEQQEATKNAVNDAYHDLVRSLHDLEASRAGGQGPWAGTNDIDFAFPKIRHGGTWAGNDIQDVTRTLRAFSAMNEHAGLKATREALERVNNSPGLKATREALERMNNSPGLKATREALERMNNSPGLKATREALERVNNSPGLKATREALERMKNSPGLKVMIEANNSLSA